MGYPPPPAPPARRVARSTPLDSSDPAVFERWCLSHTDQTLLEYCYEAPWEEACTHVGTDDCARCVTTGELRRSFEPGALIVMPAGIDLRSLTDSGPLFYKGKVIRPEGPDNIEIR